MFSKEKINIGRQPELDIARGLAVLFMVIIHVQIYFANPGVVDTYFADFNDFTGDMPAAPMFMFLLGVGINYTRKNDFSLMIRRGIGLIFTGYLLNFVRGFVPYTLKAYSFMDISYLYMAVTELLNVDILQFSGLAMIMFGLFKKYNFKKSSMAITAIIFAALNLVMLNVQTENILISAITGLFWGSQEYSYFPFLTWMFYPIAGFIFGSFLIRCTNKKKFYLICGSVAFLVFLGGVYIFNVIIGFETGLTTDLGYYHHFITDNITFTAFVILEIAILSFLVPFVPKFFTKIMARWSKNVTTIFCIHWVIIMWSTLFIPLNSFNMFWFIIYLILIIPISDLLAEGYTKIKEKFNTYQWPTVGLVLVLVLTSSIVYISLLKW